MAVRRTNGLAIRAIRTALGIRQAALAADVEISPQHLANVEAGSKQPSAAVARRIAARLGVELDAITYPALNNGDDEAVA